MSSNDSNSNPKSSLCGCAIRTGTGAFVRHSFSLLIFFSVVAGLIYLGAGRLGSSFKELIQQKVNQHLEGSGVRVAFSDIQFIDGEGIRIDNLQVFLSDAPPLLTSTASRGNVSNGSPGTGVAIGSDQRFRPLLNYQNNQNQTYVSTGIAVPQSASSSWKSYRPSFTPAGFSGSQTESVQPDISIQQLWFRGQWTPTSFVSGDFQPEKIEIVSPEVRLTVKRDGSLQLPKLRLPAPKHAMPRQIKITDGKATIACEQTAGHQWPITIESLSLDLDPSQDPTTALLSHWWINADLSVLQLPPVNVRGQWHAGHFSLNASGQPTHVHSRLWQQLRPWFPTSDRIVEGINGWMHLENLSIAGVVPVDGTPGKPRLNQFEAKATVRQMQLQDHRLPQPVLNLNADLFADLSGLRWTNAGGQIGDGTFQINGQLNNWSQPDIQAKLKTDQLRFSRRWVPLLPEKMQNDWQKFQPEGLMSCDLDFHRAANGVVSKTGTIDVQEMSYVFADFPVPISGAAGRFELENRNCRFNLQVHNQLYPLLIDGFANDMGPDWTGKVNIRSNQFHPIHSSTLQGLQKKPQVIKVIQEINPTGLMAINGFIEKKVADRKADIIFNVGFRDGVVQHLRFPYRVSGIVGQMRYQNGSVVVEKLEGVSSTGNISASGQFVPGQPWNVQLVGHAVELNTELYQALGQNQQEVWRHLRPRGVLDEVTVDLYEHQDQCRVRISGSQQPSTLSDPSYLSVNPDWFPYQLDGISGKFHYENNEVRLTGIRGSHGTVSVSFDGKGQTSQDDWQVTIYNLLTGQIPIGRDIKAALPETVKTAAEQLNMSGSVSVQGAVTISREHLPANHALVDNSGRSFTADNPLASDVHRLPSRRQTEVYRMQDGGFVRDPQQPANNRQFATTAMGGGAKLAWDLRLDMEDTSLMVGLPAKHVHGMVQLQGESSTAQAFCRGKLNIDSAMIEGIQVTDIQGPIWMNEREIAFGTQVKAAPGESTSDYSIASVAMQSMGGRVEIDGRVYLVDDMPFSIRATANHVDLQKMATTFAPETRDIAGKGYASLTMHGTSVGTHTLSGTGEVKINDARLYEVPFFLQLLKILRVSTPDKTAFDEGQIVFKIAGEDIQMNRIELNGDAISLLGRGQANFDQEIDLEFYTVLGRNRFYLPLVSDLLHASSQQLLTITVDGSVDHPQFKHETGRALNEAVRLFVEDVEASKKLSSQ